jgi:hypothetical protein
MPFAHPGNVPATYEGRTPRRRGLLAMFGWLRLPGTTSRRPARSPASDGGDDEAGAAGAGVTAPLIPRTPVLVGSAARKLGED